jgi:hypothetical protein
VEVLRDALLAEGEVIEGLRVVAEQQGLDHGGVNFGEADSILAKGLEWPRAKMFSSMACTLLIR